MAQASGPSWGSRRVQLGFSPWLSQKPRLPSPTTGGCRWGRGGCSGLLRGGSAPGAGSGWRRSWVLSRAPGEPEHAPSSAPVRGAGVRCALGYPGSVQTSPQVLGPDPARRGAAGALALCAPAPAAQLLRMTSSHLPPPGPHLPEGWGGGWWRGVLRQKVPRATGRCSPRAA